MAATDTSTLRPLTLGEILDRALRLYRQHFLTFLGIIAAMLIPITLLQIILTLINAPNTLRAMEQIQDPAIARNPFLLFATEMSASSGGGSSYLISALTFVLVSAWATAALVRAIADSYMGEPVDILGSYKKIGRMWLRLLVALILALLLYFGMAILTLVPCVGWIIGPGVIIFYLYVLNPLLPATVVLEGQKGVGAIRRAWDLTRRRFWWTLGFMVILGVFAYVILVGPTLLIDYLIVFSLQSGLPAADAATRYGIQTGITQLVTMLFQLLYLPIQLTAITLMYFDLRVRTEGLDLTMMAAVNKAEPEVESSGSIVAQAPSPGTDNLVTSREVGYFIGISLGIVALCGGLYAVMIAIVIASTGLGS